LSSVIRDAVVADVPRFLGANAAPLIDDAVAAMIDAAAAEAYQRGLRDGRRRGIEQVELAADVLRSALATATDELRSVHRDAAAMALEAGMQVAEFVLGRVPHDEGHGLAGLVAEAVDEMDDEQLTVAVSPGDREAVVARLAGAVGIDVVADERLGPGEARIVGRWVAAEFSRDIALEAARRALR